MPAVIYFLKPEDAKSLGIEEIAETVDIDGKKYAFVACDVDVADFLHSLELVKSKKEARELAERIEKLACGILFLE